MSWSRTSVAAGLVLAVVAASSAGCGQKGPLSMPKPAAAAASSPSK